MSEIINPTQHKVLVGGLQGSGKTYFSKQIVVRNNLKAIVFSPHRHDWINEPDNFYFYNGNFPKDIEKVMKYAKELCKKGIIDGIIIDEMDVVMKNNFDVGENMTDAIANHRHYDMFIMGLTRGLTDIPAYYRKSCKFLVMFALDDALSLKQLDQIFKGFGKMVRELNYENHEYVVKEIAKPPIVKPAI